MITARTDGAGNEKLLWGRVVRGVALGMVLFLLLGYGLASLGSPSMSVAGRVGVALFVGFWTGPFFGSVVGVGYHQTKCSRKAAPPLLARAATAPSTSLATSRPHQIAA